MRLVAPAPYLVQRTVLRVTRGAIAVTVLVALPSATSGAMSPPERAAESPAKVSPALKTPQAWSVVVAPGLFACGIAGGDEKGTLWCWGNNSLGQLGIGSEGHSASVSAPKPVGKLKTWADLAARGDHTCATQTNGSLWCWGNDHDGQLGDGGTGSKTRPVEIGTDSWTDLAAGDKSSCGIQSDPKPGTLWCWGANDKGQLGDGTTTTRRRPTQVGTARTWESVSAGAAHTCALRTDGSLWCWGDNSHGQLGTGSGSMETAPVQVGRDSWDQVSAGGQHTCAIRSDATLWCWGFDGVNPQTNQPTQIGTERVWTAVSAGDGDTCATKSDDSLWCWGTNRHGQIGTGDTRSRTQPVEVTFRQGWAMGSLGGQKACMFRLDRSLWCWGLNNYGQLGDHAREDRYLPTPVGLSNGWNAVSDSGGEHTCAISKLGVTGPILWCWGVNDNGQLGDGTRNAAILPINIAGNAKWSAITGGSAFTCGVQANASLWCWGANDSGQLGIGSRQEMLTPTRVGTSFGWFDVAAGGSTACGLRNPGTLWCWGDNAAGEVGDGTTTDRTKPVQVGTATNWTWVRVGERHTCALRSDESLWCWGDNSHGEVGDGTKAQRTRPVKIGTGSWTTVDAGGDFTCGIKDGVSTLWCWGIDDSGQSGQPAGPDITHPTLVLQKAKWFTVTSALDHSCGTRFGATVWCWGKSRAGDLGNGKVNGEADKPVQLKYQKSDPWVSVLTYDDRTCAMKEFMECWGADSRGQLGDGSPTPYRLMPTTVLIIPE